MDGLTIGAVAKLAKVHVETLRYYERQGLIVRPPRTGSNYRLYPQDVVQRVRFIKHAQALGFSLKEIQELLSPQAGCADVYMHAHAKISAIDAKLGTFIAMKQMLSRLVAACPGDGPRADCPILESLDAQEVTP